MEHQHLFLNSVKTEDRKTKSKILLYNYNQNDIHVFYRYTNIMIAYEMACQLHQKCPPIACLPIFMQGNWTQSVHKVQFLYFMFKIMTAHKESNRIEEVCETYSDTDAGNWCIA